MTTNSDVPKKRPRRELMESEIIAGAAKVFDEKGIGTATLQDVADHFGIGRPSLYHYFPSKAALVRRLFDDLLASTESALAGAVPDVDASATERLRHVLLALLKPVAEFPSRFRILQSSEATPDDESAERVAATRRSYRDLVRSTIEDGVRSGEFRNVDAKIATYMALGSINWVAWWYRPESGLTVEELTDGLVELVLQGIALPSREPVTVADLLRRITADLMRLGSMIEGAS